MGRSRNKTGGSPAKKAPSNRAKTADECEDRAPRSHSGDLKGQDPATASSSSAAITSSSPYLTPDELKQLKPDTKLVLDMYPLLDKLVNIYTTAEILRDFVASAEMGEDLVKGVSQGICRRLRKSCQSVDHEAFYHKMNTGHDGALLQWQQFSVECLKLAGAQYAAYKEPLPVQLDNDTSLPPAMHTAHDRARIKLVIPDMLSCNEPATLGKAAATSAGRVAIIKETPSGRKVMETRKPRPMQFPHRFSPGELGRHDDFLLDVSALVPPKQLCVITNRKDMLEKFDHVLSQEKGMTEFELAYHRSWYEKLRKLCIELPAKESQNEPTFAADVCMLAVFARLLYGTPLCIKNLEEYDKAMREKEEEEEKLAQQQEKEQDIQEAQGSVRETDLQPTPSPVGSKNGYELHCRFKEGGPKHVVQLPLEAFKDGEMVVLDMSEILEWGAFLPVHSSYIKSAVEGMGIDPQFADPSFVERLLQAMVRTVRQVNPETHVRGTDENVQKQFYQQCVTLVCLRLAKHNQPIRISCYPGMDDNTGDSMERFVERAREQCVKALTSKGVAFEL